MNQENPPFEKSAIKKIAIFRALQLGDMLCSIPAIRAIRNEFSDAQIVLIGLPWQHDLVKRFENYFDDFIEFPGWPGLPERDYSSIEVIRFLREVNDRQFDLVMQMQGNGNFVNPMCMLLGAKYVVGFRRAEENILREEFSPILDEREHEIKRFLRLIKVIGIESNDAKLEFPIRADEIEEATAIKQRLNLSSEKYICIHPGARDKRRRWSADNFSRVGDALVDLGFTILLTGSDAESELLKEVESKMKSAVKNLVRECGHIGIGEMAHLIQGAVGLLSNDTGVSHIASALQVPSVILFSSFSDPHRWSPTNSNLHKSIRTEVLSPEEVIDIALAHFQPTPNVYTL